MRPLFSCALLLTSLSGQPPATRDLFPKQPVCRLPAKEVRVGRAIFHVFPDAKSGKELFRIRIGGLYGKEWLKWWTYGVRNCGDFNRDGVLDYTWYGGDDTSLGHYLILSSPAGHRIIDIEKTFEAEWVRQRGGKAPDLPDLHESFLHKVTIHWAPNQLTLAAEGYRLSDPPSRKTRMESTSNNWVTVQPESQ